MNAAIATRLTPEQIGQFKRDGFLSIPRLVDDETLEALRAEYDRFIRGEIECGEDNRLLGGLIHQVMYPSRYSPLIRDNPAVRTAKELAAQLVGAPTGSQIKPRFDMLIDKPAGTEKETPWHQDYAYSNTPMTPAGTQIPELASMQFWVALDDVDLDNSCMQFIPGLHTGTLLPHHLAKGNPNDPERMLAITQIDSSKAVVCPLPAGGCTVHHYGTPHYTGPNRTQDRNRRAYIFNLYWPQAEPLPARISREIRKTLDSIKKKPGSWILATTFLWLPLILLGCVLQSPQSGDPRAVLDLAAWSYPIGCALAACLLFFNSANRLPGMMRFAPIPNLLAIPLWGLALYLYNAFFANG